MHRGYEKLAEVRTYPQVTLVNRIDWVSGFANEIPFIAGAEKLMEIEVPERAQYIIDFDRNKNVPTLFLMVLSTGDWCSNTYIFSYGRSRKSS